MTSILNDYHPRVVSGSELAQYRVAVQEIRNVLSERLFAAADDDDMTAVEAFVLGQITGVVNRLTKPESDEQLADWKKQAGLAS